MAKLSSTSVYGNLYVDGEIVNNALDAELGQSIKSLSVNGKTITYTKNNGTTGTIVTQDTNTTYGNATTSTSGLMSSADKTKLDGIATNANNYSHPTTSGNKHIPAGGSSGQILRWASDGTAAWGNDNNTTYSTGTASTAGLTKLYTGTGTATDGTMTQAALKTALDGKAASSHTHSYLPLSGGTLSGSLTKNGSGAGFIISNGTARTMVYSSTTVGEHIFGGSNNSSNEVADYIRIGANKLKYQTGGNEYDIYHTGKKPTPSDIGAAASSHTHNYAGSSSVGGNANAAVKLATARSINGTKFDGTGDITTANWGTTRTLTIGNTGKSVNGGGNVSWSLSEIGALPLTGGTLSGRLTANGRISAPTAGSSWISGMTITNATIGISTQQKTDSYHPVLAVKTSGNHVANIGGLGDDFGFYGFKSGRTENATDWSFKINAGTGVVSSTGNITAPTFVGALSGNASTATKATQDSAGQQINTTYIKGLSVSGKTITYTKGDGTTGTITTQDTNTTYSTGTASTSGLTKLYTGTGTATDGTMTQAAINTALSGKANSSHGTHVPSTCNTITDWNSATTTGWYMASGATNAPTANAWYFGEVIAHNTNYVIQTVYQFTASTDAKAIPKYIRAKMNGTWGSWTNVTVAKAVPSNAVFTDTNTWRGVQDNLTSTATDQSLSANQGKVLKGLIDGKAESSHTHYYAGSSSAGGAANSAVKATQDSAGQQINTTYIKGLSVSGKTITYTKGDGTTGTITTQDTNTTYSTGTASALGLTKLYTSTGTATDGTMTQSAINTALNGKANNSHTHNSITNQDTRDVNTTPTQMPLGLSVHLKSNSTDGLNDGGTYHSTLMIKGWNDVSGGPWAQMTVTANNNLYFRSSNNDTWNAWKKVSLDGHTHSYLPLSGGTVSGSINPPSDIYGSLGNSSLRWAEIHALTITATTFKGNATSAAKLSTARTINGTNFDGSANITTANWGTARTITIGATGKSVNGSGNVSWTLSEIGAAASSHTHSYLPLTGGTLTGELTSKGTTDAHGITIDSTGAYQNLYFKSNGANRGLIRALTNGSGVDIHCYSSTGAWQNVLTVNSEAGKATVNGKRIATFEGGSPAHYMFRYGSGLGGAAGYITFSY